jgi:hypothetical protein
MHIDCLRISKIDRREENDYAIVCINLMYSELDVKYYYWELQFAYSLPTDASLDVVNLIPVLDWTKPSLPLATSDIIQDRWFLADA